MLTRVLPLAASSCLFSAVFCTTNFFRRLFSVGASGGGSGSSPLSAWLGVKRCVSGDHGRQAAEGRGWQLGILANHVIRDK